MKRLRATTLLPALVVRGDATGVKNPTLSSVAVVHGIRGLFSDLVPFSETIRFTLAREQAGSTISWRFQGALSAASTITVTHIHGGHRQGIGTFTAMKQ
jgi:hypothetical protein